MATKAKEIEVFPFTNAPYYERRVAHARAIMYKRKARRQRHERATISITAVGLLVSIFMTNAMQNIPMLMIGFLITAIGAISYRAGGGR